MKVPEQEPADTVDDAPGVEALLPDDVGLVSGRLVTDTLVLDTMIVDRVVAVELLPISVLRLVGTATVDDDTGPVPGIH